MGESKVLKIEDFRDLIDPSMRGSEPFAYNRETGIDLNSNIDGLDKIVRKGLLSVTISFFSNKYFPRSARIEEFNGDVVSNPLARDIFNHEFEWKVNQKAKEIEAREGIEINGVLMSIIEVKHNYIDHFSSWRPDPHMTLRLGVAYLA